MVIEGRTVQIRPWKYEVEGIGGFKVPVYFLDTDLPENSEWDRTLTDFLYAGDQHYRLCQELILGIGGVRMLRALGYDRIERFHMNEGHASLLTLELLDEEAKKAGRESVTRSDIEAVKGKCTFTTHIEGVTGWSIGEKGSSDWPKDAASLYSKLEQTIMPIFYHERDRFIDIMLHCIALNGSFFNTHRMVQQYVLNAYFL